MLSSFSVSVHYYNKDGMVNKVFAVKMVKNFINGQNVL